MLACDGACWGGLRGLRQHGDDELSETSVDAEWVRRTRRRLLGWGRRNFQRYPWREEQDPWLSFVVEFLLQRTRATQVEPVFLAIRQRFPTASDLAKEGSAVIKALTDRLGLHWRGPLLLAIAEVVGRAGGTPPETIEELCALTGVGMYTAAAWFSLHRGKRAIIIDANVSRWLSRMTGLRFNRDPRHVGWVQALAERLTPQRAFREYNYAVLDFTMTVCTARAPRCMRCPLRSNCLYGRATEA